MTSNTVICMDIPDTAYTSIPMLAKISGTEPRLMLSKERWNSAFIGFVRYKSTYLKH